MGRAHAPDTVLVRIQDVQPGAKVARIDQGLNWVYPAVEKVLPQKIGGVTKSYKVYLEGYVPGTDQDSSIRPFNVRPTDRLDVLIEEV